MTLGRALKLPLNTTSCPPGSGRAGGLYNRHMVAINHKCNLRCDMTPNAPDDTMVAEARERLEPILEQVRKLRGNDTRTSRQLLEEVRTEPSGDLGLTDLARA